MGLLFCPDFGSGVREKNMVYYERENLSLYLLKMLKTNAFSLVCCKGDTLWQKKANFRKA